MGRRFYSDEMSVCWCLSTVVVAALLFPVSACLMASEKGLRQVAQNGSTVHDFQDVKQEVGYSDPKRFGFLWIIGQQTNFAQTDILKNLDAYTVVSHVSLVPQRRVRLDGVQAFVL